MPEIYRSLVVVLAIAMMVFAFAKAPMVAMGMSLADFKLRRNLWFGITLAAFLSNNFWVFCAVTACLLVYGVKRDSNTLALVFAVLFAVPLFRAEIGGLGIINYLFEITYFRLISIVVLFPLYLSVRKAPGNTAFGVALHEKLLAMYLVLGLLLQFPTDTFTNILRTAFYLFIDVYLPYYVASRYIKDTKTFRDVLAAFVLASLLIGCIGVFEFAKSWLLYSNVTGALGLHWPLGGYLNRGDSLRALATSGQPIVLGYVLAVALGFYPFISSKIGSKTIRMLGLLALLAGLIAPLSRGPWVGAVVGVFVLIATSAKPWYFLSRIIVSTFILFMASLATPYGAVVLDHLPFVGNVDNDNVIYRERLLTNSLKVIARNPFFGSQDFYETPEMEELRSGGEDGIIDLVNSYLGIALSRGIVGLSLFAGFFLSIAGAIFYKVKNTKMEDQEVSMLGRVLLAVLAGILVTIYTVSSITLVPIIYWLVSGLGICYVKNIRERMEPVNQIKSIPSGFKKLQVHGR